LKPNYDKPAFNFCFQFILRRYTTAITTIVAPSAPTLQPTTVLMPQDPGKGGVENKNKHSTDVESPSPTPRVLTRVQN
jgi:hypothetical protein